MDVARFASLLSRARRPALAAIAAACVLAAAREATALNPTRALTQYGHDSWQVEDGLPQNTIDAITQTRDGYLWLGTQRGLVRFNGSDFTVFEAGGRGVLGHNYVLALCEARDGALWIGTYGGGVSRLKDGAFTTYTTENGLPEDTVRVVLEDREGALWIGTNGGGLSRLRDGRFTTYTTAEGLSGNVVRAIVQDRDGDLWVGTSGGGVSVLRQGSFTTYSTRNGLPNDFVWAIREDHEGAVWIATSAGLCRYRAGSFTTYTTKDGLSENFTVALLEDRDANLWVATTGGGLNRLTAGTFSSFTTREGLSNDVVTTLFEDREGSLWIGTDGGGLNRLRDGDVTTIGRAEGLSSDAVFSIFEDRGGSVWIGTNGQGLDRVNDGQIRNFTAKDGLAHNVVGALCQDVNGIIWIGTSGGGLSRFDGGSFATLTGKDGLGSDFIRVLWPGRDGSLWIGTNGAGLTHLVGGTLTRYSRGEGLTNGTIRALWEDPSGTLWIGTNGGGLFRFENGTFSALTTEQGLSSNFVLSLYEDANGTLWIGTHGGGLNRLQNGHVHAFAQPEGLPDDVIYAILEDSRGNLWMSSLSGIFRISKAQLEEVASGRRKTVASLAFGKADGMKTTECSGGSQPSAWRMGDGRLWFRTLRGVAVIDPARINPVQDPPPVFIEQLKVDNTPVETKSGVQLPAGSGQIEFHYNSIGLLHFKKVKFKYRLAGFDSDWVQAGNRRTAYYTKLPHGTFAFEVTTSRNDGPWNGNVAVFTFSVAPRFFETRWFYGLSALAVLLTGLAAHQLRIRQIAARNADLAAQVADRTAKLEEANALLSERSRELEEANRRLELLSTVDSLSEAANRRQFDHVLDAEWRRCARTGLPLALLMLDIDHFKPFNDGYGHVTGDVCLKKVAGVVRKLVQRAGELVARYGGEEFAVLLPGSDAPHARELAETMRLEVELLAIPHAYSKVAPVVTISVGVATMIPIYGNTPGELVSAADRALYHAKQTGRNRVSLTPPG
jgi:diguanylate cyclase (GGDEF)-like protein